MADENEGGVQLFQHVVYTIIPSDEFDKEPVQQAIDAGGGHFIALSPEDERIQGLEELTHIITTHIDFPQYNAALDKGIAVVKPSWIVNSCRKGKQAAARQYSPDPSQYFHDVVVCCASLPESDREAIIAGVIALGGQHSGPLSRLVTHIVANDMDNDKCRMVEEKALNCKIVLPHWFDDCFQLGRMIGEGPYMLPDPEVLRFDGISRVRDIPSMHLDGAIVASPSKLPSSSSTPSPSETRKNLNAFMSRKIMLSRDLQLSDHLHKTLEGLISRGGATLTDDVEAADIYIGQYRDGEDYIKACRAHKEVANLSWLYHVINRNKYTNPLSKLLHYPVPRDGLPGFQNMKISISNYVGDARTYLENLIKHCGAHFTKTMKQDNTHLITAHTQSEKCEAAQEWGLHIVNHIWLEESYARCAVQTLTVPRYTHFPARTNLGEVTGQTSFDAHKLEQMYFAKPRESPKKQQYFETATAGKQSPRKTVSSATARGLDSTALSSNVPSPAPADIDAEEDRPQTVKRPRGRPPRSASTPRFRDDEKENDSPLLHSSGRASKARALSLLHEQAPDVALFQKEMKRKGGVTHGGRHSNLAETFPSSSPAEPKQRKKRTSDEATYDVTAEGSDLSDGETQAPTAKPAKKIKTASPSPHLPPVRYKMMVTGDERWLSNPHKESADRVKLLQLGVRLTQDPRDVDILVAPKLLRTRKFVAALACAPLVVDTKYLDTALKQNKLVENPAPLFDREGEERYGFKLSDAIERAAANERQLFDGWTIFVTKDVNGGYDTYKDIVTLNGGSALLYQGRTGLTLPRPRESKDDEDEANGVYLVSGRTDAELKLVKTFRALADKQGVKARVVETNWLLNAAMSQTISWEDRWEVTESGNS